MTDRTPAEQAAEALRDGQECMRFAREAWDNGTNDREYVKGASDAIDEALAALTAEDASGPVTGLNLSTPPEELEQLKELREEMDRRLAVSPDREALARRLDETRECLERGLQALQRGEFADEYFKGHSDDLIAASLAFRAPAQAEAFDTMHIEQLVKEWFAPHSAIPKSLVDGLCDVLRLRLRRLSSPSPAVGEWRPIETFDETDASKFDFWLDWADDCVKLNPSLAETAWAGEQLFRGYHRCWPSYLKATHWMPLPPAPPQETKP